MSAHCLADSFRTAGLLGRPERSEVPERRRRRRQRHLESTYKELPKQVSQSGVREPSEPLHVSQVAGRPINYISSPLSSPLAVWSCQLSVALATA